jgi:hypothetical protein
VGWDVVAVRRGYGCSVGDSGRHTSRAGNGGTVKIPLGKRMDRLTTVRS